MFGGDVAFFHFVEHLLSLLLLSHLVSDFMCKAL